MLKNEINTIVVFLCIVINSSCFYKVFKYDSQNSYVYYGEGVELTLHLRSFTNRHSDLYQYLGEFEFVKYYGEFVGYKGNGTAWYVGKDKVFIKSNQTCKDLFYVDITDCWECQDSIFRVKLVLSNCFKHIENNPRKRHEIAKIKFCEYEVTVGLNSDYSIDTTFEFKLNQDCHNIQIIFDRLLLLKEKIVKTVFIGNGAKNIFIKADIEKLRSFKYYYEVMGLLFLGKKVKLCGWDCIRDSIACFNLQKRG